MLAQSPETLENRYLLNHDPQPQPRIGT
jgi:hypothetical protein